jgi:hypothetical protein
VAGASVAQASGMEIIVDIGQGEDGRPTGTVRPAGEAAGRSFSGNLEFLALVESLYQSDSSGVGVHSQVERSQQ